MTNQFLFSKKSPYRTPDSKTETPWTIWFSWIVIEPISLFGEYSFPLVAYTKRPPSYSESLFNEIWRVLLETSVWKLICFPWVWHLLIMILVYSLPKNFSIRWQTSYPINSTSFSLVRSIFKSSESFEVLSVFKDS